MSADGGVLYRCANGPLIRDLLWCLADHGAAMVHEVAHAPVCTLAEYLGVEVRSRPLIRLEAHPSAGGIYILCAVECGPDLMGGYDRTVAKLCPLAEEAIDAFAEDWLRMKGER